MKKWTQEIVEERLIPKLKELGSGPTKVAESLKAFKIKGVTGPTNCPVANFVKKLFRTATYVAVYGDLVDLCLDKEEKNLFQRSVAEGCSEVLFQFRRWKVPGFGCG